MVRKSDLDFKSFIDQIGALFDARARTLRSSINLDTEAIVKAAEERIKNELRAELASKDDIKNMATKDDIKNMATKDDIKNMATKDDIKNMATKDDIKNMATKDDIKNMATKDDIKDMATKQDIARLEGKIDETKSLKLIVEELRKRLDKFEVELATMKQGY